MAEKTQDDDVEHGHQGRVKDPEHDGRLKENREKGVGKGTTEGTRDRAEGEDAEEDESDTKGGPKGSTGKS